MLLFHLLFNLIYICAFWFSIENILKWFSCRKIVKQLKDGEDQKRKTYLALCIAPTKPYVSTEALIKLSQTKNLELQQKTPIRVLHRRPNAIRPRSVYEMSAEPVAKEMLSHFDDLELDLDSNENSHQVK